MTSSFQRPSRRLEEEAITPPNYSIIHAKISVRGTMPAFSVLASLPNAAKKLSSRLKTASAEETLVIASVAARLGDAGMLSGPTSAKKRLWRKHVELSSHGGAESWSVADVIDEVKRTLKPLKQT